MRAVERHRLATLFESIQKKPISRVIVQAIAHRRAGPSKVGRNETVWSRSSHCARIYCVRSMRNFEKRCKRTRMWRLIGSFDAIPKDCDLMVAVIDHDGLHALELPCRFGDGCWIEVRTGRIVDVHPTHWREWPSD